MRDKWNRATAELTLTNDELTELVRDCFPNDRVAAAELSAGGLANTNIKISLANAEKPVLLRIFVRDPSEAKKESRIYELIMGKVPAPRVYGFGADNRITGHPYILMEWKEGERLEVAAPGLSPDNLFCLGKSVGSALARIHSITFARAGFLDGDLNVVEPFQLGSGGLLKYAGECLSSPMVKDRLSPDLSEDLLSFLSAEAKILDSFQYPPCLTHCDFGGSNILVDQDGLSVSAVLDWEFAVSGTPFFDFGNLLRKPLGERARFKDGVTSGYLENGGTLPDRWHEMSLLTDLSAWLEFMTRETANEALVRDAKRVITQTMSFFQSASFSPLQGN